MVNINKILFLIKKHGLVNLVKIFFQRAYQSFFANGRIIFRYELIDYQNESSLGLRSDMKIEKLNSIMELTIEDRSQIVKKMGEHIIKSHFEKFFNRKANLWICKIENQVVGWRWSKVGGFTGFDGVPFGQYDVLFIAGYVIPEYRKKHINITMLSNMLGIFSKEKYQYVYTFVKTWNVANIRSLLKVGFKQLGIFHEIKIFFWHIIIWKRSSFHAFD